jgi:putative NIF3 family GTP cyclohydrolase 1 type 2
MKAKEIYKLAVEIGIKADPRGQKAIAKILKKEKEKYQKLDKAQKEDYDLESLENPYSDTRLLLDNGRDVKKILTGIDMETGEMLLADKLGIDLVVGHHPLGVSLAKLDDVMKLQSDVLAGYGVPINIAESLLEKRMPEVSRKLSPSNTYQAVDAARLLGLSVMCAHTIADNLVYNFVKNKINHRKPETVGELLKLLKEIPEYKEATKQGAGPTIFVGKPDRHCGKIAVTELTGGTSGSKDIYERMSHFGIGTIVSMHIDEEYKAEAEKHHINVVVAGHMSSDSLGMNLFLDELQKKNIEIIPCSGLIRISRVGK